MFELGFTVIGVDGGVDDCGCGVEEAGVGLGKVRERERG